MLSLNSSTSLSCIWHTDHVNSWERANLEYSSRSRDSSGPHQGGTAGTYFSPRFAGWSRLQPAVSPWVRTACVQPQLPAMKSRCRIASSEARDHADVGPHLRLLQQGNATDEIGLDALFCAAAIQSRESRACLLRVKPRIRLLGSYVSSG